MKSPPLTLPRKRPIVARYRNPIIPSRFADAPLITA